MTHLAPRPRRARLAAVVPLLALAALAALTACQSDLGPGFEQPEGTSNVRFVHAVRGTSAVDLRWIDRDAFTGVAFGSASTNGAYAPLPAGYRHLWVTRAADDSVLTHGEITVRPAKDYSLGLVRVGPGYNLSVLVDTNDAPGAGRAKLRAWHLSTALTNVGVFVTAPGADLATAEPVDASMLYREASPYIDLAAGTYQVRFVSVATGAMVLDAGTITLAAGQIRTMAVLDAETSGARALLLPDRN